MKYTKMSKSRGNVVLPEEVVHGVYELDQRYEFRDVKGEVVDWQKLGVWRHHEGSYFTSTRTGRQPVFLHEKDNPVPCYIGCVQHQGLIAYWLRLLEKYENEQS